MSKFVHLHVHTEQSALDGLGSAGQFAQRAAELGHEAIAFTDHGTVRGLYEARKACAAHGLKLIPGCEFYVADDAGQRGLTKDEKAQIAAQYSSKSERAAAVKKAEQLRRDRYHVTAWALDNTGLDNLIALSNLAWLNGFYYKPRIDFAVLAEHAEGLAASSGCCGSGILAKPLISGKYERAQSRAQFMRDTFGDRFYVEIMPHVPEGGEGSHAQLVRIADRVGARIVATQDAHYPREQDAIAQEALLCIQTRDRLDNPDRFSLGPQSYWLRSREEMLAAFARNVPELPPSVVDDALDETHRLARRCNVTWPEVEQGKYLVAPELPGEFSSYDGWLSELCAARWFDRFPAPEPLPRYVERWHHELRVIKRLGFAPYFVMVWDVREWARKQGIRCGPGRGSAAGSLVSYLLGITDIDPLKYDLSFERFLAPGRTDLPDIDLDFQSDRRDEVFEYLRKRYGADRVAQISTYTRLKGKATLRDLARVYGLGDHEINPVLAAIRNVDPDEEVGEIQRAIDTTPAGREFSAAHPAVAEVAKRIEGTIKSVGQHPAGVVVSSVPLSEIVPIETRARGNKRVPVTGYDMRGVEASGLVKLDVLGLGHLTIIDIALCLSGATSADIDVEDKRVLDAFTRGDWGGIFQFDSPAARKLCRGVPFERFADVAVMTALNRPGPMQSGLAAEYAARKAGQQKVTRVHPVYDVVMEQTYGVPIFQEQVVELVKRLCGYSPEEADKFRKAVAKKTGLAGYEDSFIAGAVRSGMSRADASALFERLVGFARYAFNRCLKSTTLIQTWRGIVQIRDVRPGDVVFSSAGPRKVIRTCMTRKIGVRLTLDDGRAVVASRNHRFFKPNGDAVSVSDLRKGDQIGVAKSLSRGVVQEYRCKVREQRCPALLHSLSTNEEIRGFQTPRAAGRMEPREDERQRPNDAQDRGIQNGPGKLAVQRRPYPSGSRSTEAGLLRCLRSKGAEACRSTPPKSRTRGQSSGKPNCDVCVLPQGASLSGARTQPEGRHWRRNGKARLEQGQNAGDRTRPCSCGGRQAWPEARARHNALAPARIERIEQVGGVDMVDLEVEPPHDFFLSNGILSHNSHAYAYATIACWCGWLREYHPGPFYAGVLTVFGDAQNRIRIAGDARRRGVNVCPPDVNDSSETYTIRNTADGIEILGTLGDIDGIGPKADEALRSLAPFKDAVDFADRTRGNRAVTVKTFEALAKANALRSILPIPQRFLVANAREIWERLRAGDRVVTRNLPDYTDEQRAQAIGSVWPPYVDAGAAAKLEQDEAAFLQRCRREAFTVGELLAAPKHFAITVGRVRSLRVYDEDGAKSGQVSLVGSDGAEAIMRADPDVMKASKDALDEGSNVVVAASATPKGNLRIEAAWPWGNGSGEPRDRTLSPILDPAKTRPRDVGAVIARAQQDRRFDLVGHVLRLRRHSDKYGRPMATLGLLGEKGYGRILVFSSRFSWPDIERLKIGAPVKVRVRKLSGDAVCLTDKEIEAWTQQARQNGNE